MPVLMLRPVGGKVVDKAGDEGAGAGSRVEKSAPEVLLQRVVRPANNEVHDLPGSVDDAGAASGGVAGFAEVLVDSLEEVLLFGVLGDLFVGAVGGDPVGAEAFYGPAANVAGEKGLFQGGELQSGVVLAVELVVAEDAEEDILREDVLRSISRTSASPTTGPDAADAQLQASADAVQVGRVVGLGVGHSLEEVPQPNGEVGLELLPGMVELLALGQFVVEGGADEAVQIGEAGRIGALGFGAILVEDGGEGVHEDDAVSEAAAIELGLDFDLEVIVATLTHGQFVATTRGVLLGHSHILALIEPETLKIPADLRDFWRMCIVARVQDCRLDNCPVSRAYLMPVAQVCQTIGVD